MDSAYKGDWRSTKDPKSGKTYYYNVKTRETTWKMPTEMLAVSEREKLRAKTRETDQFFKDMEENILRKARGQELLKPSAAADAKEMHSPPFPLKRLPSSEFTRNTSSNDLCGTNLRYRTISSVDDEIVELMKYTNMEESSSRLGTSPGDVGLSLSYSSSGTGTGTGTRSRSGSAFDASGNRRGSKLSSFVSLSPGTTIVHDIADAKTEISHMNITPISISAAMSLSPVSRRRRRNSTGTIYIENTMACQDNTAMIHVVCVVIRAHMLAGEKITDPYINRDFEVFNDDYSSPKSALSSPAHRDSKASTRIPNLSGVGDTSYGAESKHTHTLSDEGSGLDTKNGPVSAPKRRVELPSLKTIKDFFNQIYNKSQLESECIIMTLVYCERLIVKAKGKLTLRHDNWKAILFASIVMASKVWDDLSMWNVDFSHVSSNLFDLKRVNELELAMLDIFGYVVKVSAGDYAKYYFQLRSLIARLKFNAKSKTGLKVSDSLHVDAKDPSGGGEDDNNNKLPTAEIYELMPLDIIGARKLQLATEKYETRHASSVGEIRRRSTSTVTPGQYGADFKDGDAVVPVPLAIRRFQSDTMDSMGHHHIASEINHIHHPVLLEQLMHAEHNDADGVAHTSSSKNHTPVARGAAGNFSF